MTRCEKCGSTQLYFSSRNGTTLCRKCGNLHKPKQEEPEKKEEQKEVIKEATNE